MDKGVIAKRAAKYCELNTNFFAEPMKEMNEAAHFEQFPPSIGFQPQASRFSLGVAKHRQESSPIFELTLHNRIAKESENATRWISRPQFSEETHDILGSARWLPLSFPKRWIHRLVRRHDYARLQMFPICSGDFYNLGLHKYSFEPLFRNPFALTRNAFQGSRAIAHAHTDRDAARRRRSTGEITQTGTDPQSELASVAADAIECRHTGSNGPLGQNTWLIRIDCPDGKVSDIL
jgi:hypothetical protein